MSKETRMEDDTLPVPTEATPTERLPVKPLASERVHYVNPEEIAFEKELLPENVEEETIEPPPTEETVGAAGATIINQKFPKKIVVLSYNDDYETVVEAVGN